MEDNHDEFSDLSSCGSISASILQDLMNDRDDTSFWNASPLCGEVFFAGWPQWTAHEDQVDSAKYLLFRVFEVEEIYFIFWLPRDI